MTDDAINLNIDQRQGWPEALRVLLKDYPRDSWRSHRLPITEFWLDKHNYFRHQCAALESAASDYREQRSAPAEFGAMAIPRLQGFLGALHGHHQIEDYHYFPSFRAAEPRLAPGFDVLADDHELLHQGIVDIVETANQFISTIREGASSNMDTQRHAGDRFVNTATIVYRRLLRHLDDEEDLIIPLMLKQGHD